MSETRERPTAGLLIGLKAIADFLGIEETQAKRLKTKHGLPTFKQGKSVCASPEALTAHVRQMSGAGAAPGT